MKMIKKKDGIYFEDDLGIISFGFSNTAYQLIFKKNVRLMEAEKE